jgi:predicted DNA-binding protein with PD1-like motif
VVRTLIREGGSGREIMARLDFGQDLLDQILLVATREGIEIGVFSVIGALQRGELGYYDQESHEYIKIMIYEPTELVACSGNITMRDGKPFAHAHAALGTSSYGLIGGHLHSGVIFAADLYLKELLADPLVRSHDPITGLYLWSDP